MQERLNFAFDNMRPSDWEKFEAFASAFLASYYPELRTVAKPHDGGRDSELFSPVGNPQIVFQYSITEKWESKIQNTIERLSSNEAIGKNIIKLIYVTNQKIGASADNIKNEIFNSHNIVLDIYDRTYFLDRLSQERIEIAESLCQKIVDPILKAQNLFNSGIQSFDSEELQMAHLFLSLQSEDQNQSKNLTKKVYESIVLSVLRKTSSSSRKKYQDIIKEAISLLPEHPQDVVRNYIDVALVRLKKGKIKHWQKDNEYCLSNAMINELTSKTAIFSQRINKVKEIILSGLPKEVEVSDSFPSKVISFIEKFLYYRGDVFCLSILDKREVSLSSEDLLELVNKNYDDFKQEIRKPKKLDINTLTAILQNCMLAAFNASDEELNLFWRSRADSYTTMAFLKKTPNVKGICKKLVSGDVIVDTCILLPLIAETNSCDERKTYLKIIKKAQANGMEFYATEYAISEILSHIDRCFLFKNFMAEKKVSSWIGDVPLLYSAFIENNFYDHSFEEWIISIRGNSDYVNNVRSFLEDELDISVLDIEPSNEVPFKSDLNDIWKNVHRKRRISRGLPIIEETIEKLSRGDSDTYEYVFEQRQRVKSGDLGYKHWWLTLDKAAFVIPNILKKRGFTPHTSPAMGIDYLGNYVSLYESSASDLPITMDSLLIPNLDVDILLQAEKVRDSLAGKSPRYIKLQVREMIHALRGQKGYHSSNIYNISSSRSDPDITNEL